MNSVGKSLVLAGALTGALMLLAGASGSHTPTDKYLRPMAAPAPADNKVTPDRVELGKALFFDPRLSGSNWISCATCHEREGGAAGLTLRSESGNPADVVLDGAYTTPEVIRVTADNVTVAQLNNAR